MELRMGYKQTELGVIPVDWEVLPIDKIFTFYSTSNYSKAQMDFDGDVGCIHYGLIHAIPNSIYDVRKGIKYYVTKEQANYGTIKNGDIIMVDASEDLEGVNKSIELFGIEDELFIAGLHTYLLRDSNSILANGFRGAILNSTAIKSQFNRLAVGMKVFGVSKPQLRTVLIPVPTKAEQTAIATALSDMDNLIAGLEKLIEKKKAIKQGAMQELLRPKEGWVVKRLKDLLLDVIDNRGKTPPYESNSDIELLETNTISFTLKYPDYSKVTKYVKTDVYNNWFRGHPKMNDILVSTVGEYSGASAIMEKDRGTIAQNLIALRFNGNLINCEFVFYWFRSRLFDNQLKEVMMNLAQPSLRVPWLLNFSITFPEKLDLQEKIANILSDVDSEINSLNLTLSKYQMLKQGMMRELLTGKTRLV